MRSSSNIAVLADIARVVPLLFHRLRAIGDDLHADLGITTPMRGVMQSLFDGGPQTVPQMAAARPVSRQHIQTQVDALAARGLVAAIPNPAHKRSSHIALTDAGRKIFESMRKKEIETLSSLLGGLSGAELKTTQQTLVRIADKLALLSDKSKETDHDD